MRRIMQLNLVLCSLLILIGCSVGEDNPPQPRLELKRLDFSLGSMDDPYTAYEYHIGPHEVPYIILDEETRRGHLRLITHIYNEVEVTAQHMSIFYTGTAEEITEHEIPFEHPLFPCVDESQAWTTGWEIYVVMGMLKKGDYTICTWVESHGRISNGECLDIIVIGEGDIPPESMEFKQLY